MSDIHELRARQAALETANQTLLEAFKTVDGDAHTALNVAQQNIKLMTALRETQLAHGDVIAGLVVDVAGLKTDVVDVKTEVSVLRTEVNDRLNAFAGEIGELKGDVGQLKGDVGELKEGLAEVLRRLPA